MAAAASDELASRRGYLRAAAAASAVGAVIHLVVVPGHAREWWLYAAFFLAVAVAQAALAWLLLRGPSMPTVLAGIWGTLLVVGTYVASRTGGLPLTPPDEGHPALGQMAHLPVAGGVGNGIPVMPASPVHESVEGVGAVDLLCLLAELAVVVLLVGLLPPRARRVTTNALLAAGIAMWAVRLVTSW